MKINIQKASLKDVNEIKKLLDRSWNTTYSKNYSQNELNLLMSEWHSIQSLTEQIQDPSIIFLVAKENDKIVGMCNGALTEDTSKLNIHKLHILPEYKNKGIGSLLMKEIIKHFSKIETLQLEVVNTNKAAIEFYEKKGFKKTGNITYELQNVKIPCFIMEMKIS